VVGQSDVQRLLVDIGVHGDTFDRCLAAGADDAHGNLTAIRDQYAFQSGC
jgi:hypothetical protein